jgi:predicted ArsR family transcriptional regulator
MTKVTELQNEYLILLKDGPKTTREISEEVDRSMAAANKVIKKLSTKKLVTTGKKHGGRGLTYLYSLTKPYDEMSLEITANATGKPIPEEEILYAAILRNATLVGQRLSDQYQKLYPHRTQKSIGNIVGTARRRRLCL